MTPDLGDSSSGANEPAPASPPPLGPPRQRAPRGDGGHTSLALLVATLCFVMALDSRATGFLLLLWPVLWFSFVTAPWVRRATAWELRFAVATACGWTGLWTGMALNATRSEIGRGEDFVQAGWPWQAIVGLVETDTAPVRVNISFHDPIGFAGGYVWQSDVCAGNFAAFVTWSVLLLLMLPRRGVCWGLALVRFVAPLSPFLALMLSALELADLQRW